jgi:hypothetical protein
MNAKILTTDQLIDYCKTFAWNRAIKQLHVHHCWKPDHSDYNGSNGIQLQEAMRNYHVNTLGWQDIGQHLTLLPDGNWVTGRDFNIDPASISGWNTGAFAIEMLGNFDTGYDKFEGAQAEAMFKFCAAFVKLKTLNIDDQVKFHRDNPTAGKTCPGSGIDRAWFMGELKKHRAALDIPVDQETWKNEGMIELAVAGLLDDPAGWIKKRDENIPVWAAMRIMNRIYKKLKG